MTRDRAGKSSGSVLFDESSDQRLAEIFAPCFTLILQLRAADDFGDSEVLRRRIKELLDDADREALRTGISSDNIQTSKFALVAFIDETILSSSWSQKDEWVSTPLQLELYDQYDAGEVFFDRLDELRGNARANAEALEVYYFCMTLGFKGKYQLHEQERLREIVERVYKEISRLPGMGTRELAPHGKPRGQVAKEIQSKMPSWMIPTAAALVGLVVYIIAWLWIDSAASTARRAIEEVGATGGM